MFLYSKWCGAVNAVKGMANWFGKRKGEKRERRKEKGEKRRKEKRERRKRRRKKWLDCSRNRKDFMWEQKAVILVE